MPVRKVYRGKDIEVSFDLDLCIHVAECLRGNRRVFELKRRPWVLPDMAAADEVEQVVRLCPSGALLYRRIDGGQQEETDGPTTVTPVRNGPLLVIGKVEVTREDGSVEVLPRATLCRCGQSLHKPFCDNQHIKIGFSAPGMPFKLHLSPVRPQLDQPISKAEDPRGN
ncbi:MAG TPA: (4Fe-4S)-binding protein [Candidatus Dormibacteraeota bacterium]|nr:(4Fe-4S)-binding protein [Candidatus Dormibacteraeota bacterium]